jgi:predicted porin
MIPCGPVADIRDPGATLPPAWQPAVEGAPAGQQCEGTNSTQITVALRYIFSKRTHAYISYNKMDNDTRYNHDFTGAAMTARTLAATGADPVVIAAGVIHNF